MPRSRPGAAAPADEPVDDEIDDDLDDDEAADEHDLDEDLDDDGAAVVEGAAGPLPPPLGMWAIIGGFVAAIVLSQLAFVPLLSAGWGFVPAGNGAAIGQVAGHLAIGEPAQVVRSIDDLPLWAYALVQLPFWVGLLAPAIGIAWYRYGPRGALALPRWVKLRFRWIDVPIGIAVGVACQLAMVSGLYWIVFRFTAEQDVSANARRLTDRATDSLGILVLLLVVGLAAPLVEELYFRGLTLQVMDRRWGGTIAVLASSLFFATTHFQGLQFPAYLVFGLILAFLVHRFDRLGPAIVAHMSFNVTATVVLVGFGT